VVRVEYPIIVNPATAGFATALASADGDRSVCDDLIVAIAVHCYINAVARGWIASEEIVQHDLPPLKEIEPVKHAHPWSASEIKSS